MIGEAGPDYAPGRQEVEGEGGGSAGVVSFKVFLTGGAAVAPTEPNCRGSNHCG